MKIKYILPALVCLLGLESGAQSPPANMKMIKGGTYVPFFGSETTTVKVQDFYMDMYLVTNAEYLEFVKKNPEWQKSKVRKIFADKNYLNHWEGDTILGKNKYLLNEGPVINISWYAAKAYCACQDKRLATVDEWEYAAQASETKPNASRDPAFYQKVLDWYSVPNPTFLPPVRTGFKNYYGIYGLIGLVWEWNSDFNTSMMNGESRAAGPDRQLFCGAGSSGSTNTGNYAAYMRYAFRSSLKANYAVSNLGFRCVKTN